jgi:hypothetical protein
MSNRRLTKTKFSNARHVRYLLVGAVDAGAHIGESSRSVGDGCGW